MFRNVNLSNLKNILQRTDLARYRAFLGHLEAQILKTFPLSINHGGAFVGSMYALFCPKKNLDTSLYLYVYYFHVIKWIRESKDLCAKKLKISSIQK